MSWRSDQLGGTLCDQDRIIIELFKDSSVNYVGYDQEFKQHLKYDANSANLVLILNDPMWLSNIADKCKKHLSTHVNTFYIGINRYRVLGNDTTISERNTGNHSKDLIAVIAEIAASQGFTVAKYGHFDQDRGKYFNFVQPLTWVYGYKTTN